MKDVHIPFEEMQDPQGLNMPDLNMSRDPARTPMQWNSSKYAGFTTARPWLRISDDYTLNNVEEQLKDDSSTLLLYKQLIALRQSEPSLLYGDYHEIFSDAQLIAYTRKLEDNDGFLIVLNLTSEPATFIAPPEMEGNMVLSNTGYQYDWNNGLLEILPDEGLIIHLTS
jgi:alpha-glucosidase